MKQSVLIAKNHNNVRASTGLARQYHKTKSTKGSSYLKVLFVVLKFARERRDYCSVMKSNKYAIRGVLFLGRVEIAEKDAKYIYAKMINILFANCSTMAEVIHMQWFKRNLWKTGISIASALLLLVVMVWVPVSAVDTHRMTSELATPRTVTMQTTPVVDPTITAQTAQEQLTKLRRENDRSIQAWLWNSVAALGTIGAAIVAFLGVLASLKQTRKINQHDRKTEQKQRDEERFQATVMGFGNEQDDAKIGSAIGLRTFLGTNYRPFYLQTFDLAVAYLRPKTSKSPENQNTCFPLNHVLISVFNQCLQGSLSASTRSEKTRTTRITALSLREDYVPKGRGVPAGFLGLSSSWAL
jgi:hypothetical protein